MQTCVKIIGGKNEVCFLRKQVCQDHGEKYVVEIQENEVVFG